MKKLLIIILSFLGIYMNAWSQSGRLDVWSKPGINNKTWTATSSIFLSKEICKKTKLTAFLLTGTGGFSEALFGVNQKIAKTTSFGFSVGFEAGEKNPLRFGSSFFTSHKKISLLVLGEYGANDSYWYKYHISKKQGKTLIGLFGQKGLGHGLRFDVPIYKNINVWLSGTYNPKKEELNIPFGVYLQF